MDLKFENTMVNRFWKMFLLYSWIAAYLLVKVETNKLTENDVETAKKEHEDCPDSSTLVKMIAGYIGEKPDLEFLRSEGLRSIAFDLALDQETYLKSIGEWTSEDDIWKEEEPK